MKTKSLLSVLTAIIFLVTILFTLTTCKKKSEDPPPANEFVISPTAKFIVDNDWQSMVKNIDSANFTLTCSNDILTKYSLAQGSLLVSSVGNGLLRKIETITQSGNDVTIQTSQATLVDLIQQGTVDFKGSLTIPQIKSIKYYYPGVYLDTVNVKSTDGTLFNWNINTEIAPLIRLQGNFQYTADFILQIEITILEGLKKVKFGFEGDENFNLALVAGKQFDFSKEITLFTVDFTPFVVLLGVPPFAIVVAPVLDINLGLSGYANANITTTLSQNFTIGTGMQYLKETGWSSYLDTAKSLSYTPPQLNMNAGAEAYIKPELQMLIYNLVGPYVNGKGYGRIAADLTQTPWWKMYYGFTMGVGVKAEILGEELFDYSKDDLLVWEQQVGQSTGTPPAVTTTGVSNITETTANCGGNVTDQGSSSVTARGICWSTSSDPTISDNHTTDGSGTGSFTSNITGLTANTPYYVKAYATNSDGTGYGDMVSFTTTGDTTGQPCPGKATVTYEGKTYNTVQIGTQCWLRENLNVGTRINGTQNQSDNSIIEKYCYDNNEANCNTYGGLYQWNEMMQYINIEGAKGICPSGWHLPSIDEWGVLIVFLGGESIAGGKMKEAGTTHWASPNTGATNSSGFTALPGGERGDFGDFYGLTESTSFFSTTEKYSDPSTYALGLALFSNGGGVNYGNGAPKKSGTSARCIKD